MFHSAALKLTAWYLALIMALSIGMSLALYHVSAGDLNRGANRRVGYFNNYLSPGDLYDYSNQTALGLHEDIIKLRGNLVLFNIIVLAAGGAASYGLARRTLRPIEESHQAQERFAADASHELRTPLTVMQSETEVTLRDKSLTKASAVKQLKSNLEEVAKLRDLSDHLLKLASTTLILKEPVNLRSVVDTAVDQSAKGIAANNTVVSVSGSAARVVGDKSSLTQLVMILLDNAIKYSPRGSKIRVKLNVKDGYASISVADQGIGIHHEDLPKIFDRFYRADSSRTKSSAGGYGLGLALAKKIAESHLAVIEVESAPNKGSRFRVSLPAA